MTDKMLSQQFAKYAKGQKQSHEPMYYMIPIRFLYTRARSLQTALSQVYQITKPIPKPVTQ